MAGSATPAEAPAAAAEAAAPAAPPVQPVPKDLPAILARVNGESIERWEMETALHEIETMTSHPIISSQRDGLIRNLLDRIIAHHLLAQEARAQLVRISDADVDADVAKIRQEYPSQQAFEEELRQFGTTLEHLRRQTRLSLEVARFVEQKMATGPVADSDIEGYYQKNLKKYQAPEMVGASHILIRIYPDASAQQRAEARTQAENIAEAVHRGADFEELARQASQDDSTAADGGSLGTFPRGAMDPAFEQAAFAMKVGEVSDPVETRFGYHVIKMLEHRPARTAPLSEVKGDIEQLLSDEAKQSKLDAFVKEAKAKAKIEIFI
jgi:peptidyl-prolyl cis-trans isomerase C